MYKKTDSQEKISYKQCNVQLPADLVDKLKTEAHNLTGHKRRGLSDLLAICARHGWEAYQRGEVTIEREIVAFNYRLVKGN
jgi:hypothetical protein